MKKIPAEVCKRYGNEYLSILVMFVRENLLPEEAFLDEMLDDWAKRKGYIKPK